ncbi:MAG TPA: TolC family protein [Blastocatellia bacterium]|nr:TolC family protein [Blastocatellia bacterium]
MNLRMLLLLAGALSISATAQTGPSIQRAVAPSQQVGSGQPAAVSPQMPSQLSGVDPNKILRWTLKDAIVAALEKNPDIEIERQNVRLAQYNLLAAQGVYDPLATSSIIYNRQRTPNLSRFSGSSQNFLQVDTLDYNFGFAKAVERTGGNYQVSFDNSRQTSNTSNLSTSYNPALTANFTQPLLRNFGIDANRHQIQIARKRLDLSDAQFRQQAIQIIANVQQSYWTLAFAIRTEEIQREALRLAETQLNNNQEQVKVGTLAPIDVVTAATQVETVRQQVFQAMQAVAQAEDALKMLTLENPDDDAWTAKILPAESFELKPFTLPLPDAIKLALANRPEVRQFALQKEINDVDVKYFRNQAKPQVDLVSSYGLVGIGGAVASFPDQNGVLQPVSVAPGFIGGYGTALGNLFNNSSPSWRVGVNISLPLHNRTAQANLGGALETGRQLGTQLRKQLLTIETDVRTAYHAIEASALRYAAARSAREYAEQQLTGEQEKFAAGLSTTFLVLTRQNDLSQARGTEVQALTDYEKAIASLQLAVSTTLSDNSVEVKSGRDEPVDRPKK